MKRKKKTTRRQKFEAGMKKEGKSEYALKHRAQAKNTFNITSPLPIGASVTKRKFQKSNHDD